MEEDEVTDFQLHVPRGGNIIDYTEVKLRRIIVGLRDPNQRESLQALTDLYLSGSVAICWKKGHPAWFQVR